MRGDFSGQHQLHGGPDWTSPLGAAVIQLCRTCAICAQAARRRCARGDFTLRHRQPPADLEKRPTEKPGVERARDCGPRAFFSDPEYRTRRSDTGKAVENGPSGVGGCFKGFVHFLSLQNGELIARAKTDGSAITAPLYLQAVLCLCRRRGVGCMHFGRIRAFSAACPASLRARRLIHTVFTLAPWAISLKKL